MSAPVHVVPENLPPTLAANPAYLAMRQAVSSHRSIRKFAKTKEQTPKDVPDEILADILQTAMRSSNNGNMQTLSVIVTKEQERREQLALIHSTDKMIGAPVVLTFVADWTLMRQWCRERGALDADPDCYSNHMAYLTSALDAMVYAQTVAALAEAAGLGICFHGSTIWATDRLNKFFELPEGAHVVTSITLGWPAEDPAPRARLDMRMHMHHEKFGRAFVGPGADLQKRDGVDVRSGGKPESSSDADGEQIRSEASADLALEHYNSRETEGWKRYIEMYGPEQWSAKLRAHKLENLAQVYTVLKYSGRDYRDWTNMLFESLERQGFGKNKRQLPEDDERCAACGVLSHCLDPDRFQKKPKL